MSPGRTITEADIVGFAALSGDWFPLHTDEEYARKGPYKTRIAHGLLGLALTEGMKFRIPEFMNVAYTASLYWNYRFTNPIHIGDTVRVKVRVESKRETKSAARGMVIEYISMLNQRDEVVGEGDHGLLVLRRGKTESDRGRNGQ
nr:MaoC/PaaZ C-terminal domain-containing protein [Aromatoleum bremense]